MLFRRDLIGHRIKAWYALLERLAAVQLSIRTDEFRWNLHENESFSVGSMYKALNLTWNAVDKNKKLWKMKIPLKINFLVGMFFEE
jgi:hypothetical protein